MADINQPVYSITMQKWFAFPLSVLLLFSSCSYRQFNAVATGGSVGGMLGSSIGGLVGGPRGHDTGILAGMVIGGAIGAAVTAPKQNETETRTSAVGDAYQTEEVHYGTYRSPRYTSPSATRVDLSELEICNVHFLDGNNNARLDKDEEACIVMDIYNRGNRTLYNVTPNIMCSSRRVNISPAATVNSLQPGQGIRYRASVRTNRRLKDDAVLFYVNFGSGKQMVKAKTFKIQTGR